MQKWLSRCWPLVVLCVLSALLFLWRLGAAPFIDYDEAAYAAITATAMKTGHYLTFVFDGRLWFEKPPLYFWLASILSHMHITAEWAYRLPAALSGVACVVLVYVIIRHETRDRLAAFFAGFVLVTTAPFLEAGREMRFDVPVAATMLASLYGLLRGFKDRRYLVLIGPMIGLGVMLKSAEGLFTVAVLIMTSMA